MKKKLSKHGNSFAVIIDKPILDLLSINEKTILNISTDGSRIIIEPKRAKQASISDDKKMQKIYEKLVAKYSPALKKLADN
jgi:antitoxin MazE